MVRRLFLAPVQSMRWHRDPFHRVTVVLRGVPLAIEFRDERSSIARHRRTWAGRLA